MTLETLKPFVAILTFFLGLLSIPFVEYLKDKTIRKRSIKNLDSELEDEIEHLANRIKKMSLSIDTLIGLKNKEVNNKGSLLYIPRKTTVLFVDSVLESNYSYIEKRKRSALKSIQVLIEALKKYCNELSEIEMNQDNIDKRIKLKKSYIYSACCLRYNMQYVINSKDKTDTDTLGDKEVINQQLEELELDLVFDNLISRKKITIS